MPSHRLSSTLAVRLLGGILLSALAGCCCGPVGDTGNGCIPADYSAGHGRNLRHGTLPPPVPPPAVASPIPRYHPLPTHPVFESQPTYSPLAPLTPESELLAPGILPESSGEPTPALLPPATSK